MNHHVMPQLSDYVLNRLPFMERQAVERHTAVCHSCQQALEAEREIGQQVRLTLHTATQPANGRLAQFMPAIPRHKKRPATVMMGKTASLQRPLALVGLLVVILFGTVGAWNGRSHNSWGVPSPTAISATATSTQDITATIAQQTSQAQQTAAVERIKTTAVASPASQPSVAATPPPPTPVAAIPSTIAAN